MEIWELQAKLKIWRKERTPSDLLPILKDDPLLVRLKAACVIAEEAAEVLELHSKKSLPDLSGKLAEELADVIIATCDVANLNGIDLTDAIHAKMHKLWQRQGLRHIDEKGNKTTTFGTQQ